jgi:hypothetical protein
MQRRSFLKAGGTIAVATGLGTGSLWGHVPTHNFDKYDFGPGPPVSDRLYQGPFSADDYPPPGEVPDVAQGDELEGAEAQGGDRGKGPKISGALGLWTKAERRRQPDAAPERRSWAKRRGGRRVSDVILEPANSSAWLKHVASDVVLFAA